MPLVISESFKTEIKELYSFSNAVLKTGVIYCKTFNILQRMSTCALRMYSDVRDFEIVCI